MPLLTKARLYLISFLLLVVFPALFAIPLPAQTPQVVSVTLDRSEIVGESVQAATATITVAPAPSSQTPVATNCGGSVVFYNCPGTVYVAAGETTASFTFQAGLVTQPTTATVTATLGGTASASLTVTPPTHTISASPTSIICGSTQSSTVTITLAVPVRNGSTATFTITKSTSPPATVYFYTIPTYVHIQGGQTTGSFTFQTGGAISQTTVLSITATYASAQTAEVTLEPPQLSLSLSPGSLFGGSGQKSTGTVTFSAPVRDTTGVSMSRTPSTPNLFNTFPTWVNIPAGGSSGTFSFEAAATTSAATITITATWGTSASTQLVVYPGNPDLGPCKDCNAQGGHPINLTNGNVWLQQRDYSLPGLAGGIELVRTWNSLWLTSSPTEISGMFGHSWRSTYEERLAAGTTTKYWRNDGSVWQFQWDSVNQAYVLVAPTDEYALLTYDSGTTLYTLTFHDGSKKIFNNSGYLSAILDRNGNQTTITLDGSNRITQVTDAAGRTLTFNYPNGTTRQVQSIQDSVGTIATNLYDGTPKLTKVTYADGSFNTFTYDTSAKLLDVKDTSGKVLEAHTYDASRRGLTSLRANNVEKITISYTSSTATRVTDSLNNITDYAFQPIGARRWITSITGSGCVTCGGRGDGTFAFDLKGRRTSSTDALGRATTYTYDLFHNLTSRSVQLNPQTTLTWSYTYNSFGQALTATDPMGYVTTSTYDANGNLLSTTTPSPDGQTPGSTTSFTYDVKGQLTRITDQRGNPTDITYTAAGLIATVKDAQNNTTTYAYDARGNRTSATDALNNATTFTYDAMNRLTKITAPGNIITEFTYDNRGRRTTVKDANGKITTYAYDDADRLTSVTDAATNVTAYAYDTENNLTSITDALGRVTSFAYDNRGRVTTVTFPSTLTESYTYDAVGNLLSKTDRKGQTISYTYDNLDRLTRKQYPDSSGVDYTYDILSRLTRVVGATGTYDFAYDRIGRLTGTTTAYSFLTSRTFPVGYAYDAASNRVSMTDPESGVTSYAYDTLNRLTTLTPPSAISGPFTFTYDALSRRTQLARPNNVTTDYTYDNLSRLLSVLHKLNGNTIDGATYTVDSVGNRTAKTNHLPSAPAEAYSYDNIYQLTQTVQNGTTTTESYTHDAVGNRLSSLGVAPYTYNQSNQLTSTPNATFTYDANGNTLTKADSAGTTTYAWDYENRLVSITLLGSGGTVSFTYDPLGRRVRKVFGSTTTVYAYEGENIIEEADAAGTVAARYSMGPSIDEPLAMLRASVTYFASADGLGSITWLTDGTGASAATYIFDTFGNLAASTGSVVNPFRYTAREWDAEPGLYFYRARYYAQGAGRFVSEDPIGFEGGANFYAYVFNNPTNLTDPSGNNPATAALAACLANPACAVTLLTATAVVATYPPAQEVLSELSRSAERALARLGDRIKPRAVPLPREATGDRDVPFPVCDKRSPLDRCLDACAAGGRVWENFCRSLRDPKLRAACWKLQFASETACRGWCFWQFSN